MTPRGYECSLDEGHVILNSPELQKHNLENRERNMLYFKLTFPAAKDGGVCRLDL
jgi:hypothetical protein